MQADKKQIAKYTIKDEKNILIQKSANIVSMRSVGGEASAENIRATTIPPSYRPTKKVDIPLFVYSSGNYAYAGYVQIFTDGTVGIAGKDGNPDTTNTFTFSSFNGCWII